MPEIAAHSAENPEFARVVEVARLRRGAAFDFDLAPTDAEAAALARLLGAVSVAGLSFTGSLVPAAGGWDLAGRLVADVEQSCVVTLEPVASRVEAEVRRRFVPQAGASPREGPAGARPREIDVEPLEEDEIEPLGPRIDLGLVAIEALALALPDYPRAEGAALAEDGIAPDRADPEEKPFAALASLREKLRQR